MSAQCEAHGPAWLAKHLRARAGGRRLPLSGTCELTAGCNLRCSHCYIIDHGGQGPDRGQHDLHGQRDLHDQRDANAQDLLYPDIWAGIFDELAAAGCLWLGLTGGEPLVHPGFVEIYRAARSRGFLVTLLTNGTLLSEDLADLLAGEPPMAVEVSLYGTSANTYEAVTGRPWAFEAAMAGIHRLFSRGLRFSLKTTLTRDNAGDLPAMRALAADLAVPFRTDGLVCGHLGGDPSVTEPRLHPTQLVALEFSTPEVPDAWEAWAEHLREIAGRPRRRLDCGAAQSTFHVDWRGRLSPCLMLREPAVDITKGGFAQGWEGPLGDLARAPASPDAACITCSLAPVCSQCLGFGALAGGDPSQPDPFLCALAKARREALEELRPETRWTL